MGEHNGAQRRAEVARILEEAAAPVSAAALARRLSVSRQIIVGDVALLRAAGARILATPRGYLLERRTEGMERTVACVHTPGETQAELNAIVDAGGEVVDVIVEHPVYGQLTGELHLQSRYDVAQFIRKINEEDAHSLSELTGGTHLHTLRCPGEELFQKVCEALGNAGYLLKE